MNKLLIGILAGLVVIIGLLVNLTKVVQLGHSRLGVSDNAGVQIIASSTATYFGCIDNAICAISDPRTGTTTLLTMSGVDQYDAIGLEITSVSTTTSTGVHFFQPEISYDASRWLPIHKAITTNTGAYTDRITLNASTASTTISWAFGVAGTVATHISLSTIQDLAGARYLRVRAWSGATSTLLVRGLALSQ